MQIYTIPFAHIKEGAKRAALNAIEACALGVAKYGASYETSLALQELGLEEPMPGPGICGHEIASRIKSTVTQEIDAWGIDQVTRLIDLIPDAVPNICNRRPALPVPEQDDCFIQFCTASYRPLAKPHKPEFELALATLFDAADDYSIQEHLPKIRSLRR